MQFEAVEHRSHISNSFHLFVQSKAIMNALFSRKAEGILARERTAETTAKTEIAQNVDFDLLNVLIELVEEMPNIPGKADLYLRRTLETQLEATLSEHIQLPFHSSFSEVDLERFALGGELFIFHPGYRKLDLISYADNAVKKEQDPLKKARYTRERDQLQGLYIKLLAEMELSGKAEASESTWQEARAEKVISARVLHDLGLQEGEPVFVARKHVFSMPRNTEVYVEGLSYLNMYQLVFLPRQGRMILTMDHLYEELNNEEHARALRLLEDPDKDMTVSPSQAAEEALMKELSTLNAESSLALPLHIFSQLLSNLHESEKNTSLRFMDETFRKQNEVKAKFSNIRSVAEFLYKILVAELVVCKKHEEAVSGLKQRLNVALEMAMHPLLSGNPIQQKQSIEIYTSTYLQRWLKKNTPDSLENVQITSVFLKQLEQERVSQRVTSTDQQHKRDEAIKNLSASYPAILQRISSQAQCAAGSFGGLTNLAQFESMTRSLGTGPLVNFSQLQSFIGADRAKDWKMGVCINPGCSYSGLKQFVGECGLCLSCEMKMSGFEESPKTPGVSDAVRGILDGPINGMSGHLAPLRVVHETDIMAYMLSGNDLSTPLR